MEANQSFSTPVFYSLFNHKWRLKAEESQLFIGWGEGNRGFVEP
ncbi:hypothetical protein WAX74_12690 [Psychrobacillus sp. FJAT-51614]|uniref:Uncharacterized protein n=1 Tax=Psychrobacillus mangrovi TaxID=3117745 RepID=A0ABU8F648_9BACI